MKNGHYYIQYIPKEALKEFKELTAKYYSNNGGLDFYLDQRFYSFGDFISSGFDWSKSTKGATYWVGL